MQDQDTDRGAIAPDTGSPTPLTRRTVVAGAGVAALGATLVLAGCSNAANDSASGSAGQGGGVQAPAGTALGAVSDVPVGGAKIYASQGVVVTQPTAGKFDAFSTVCPHQGCNVNQIQNAEIVCPCHGSTFGLDGAVVNGPAQSPLESVPVTVKGDQITVA
ncbi:Rieske (2Fe-2S) protein [Pseudonocardia acidicola]|uniref:Cytochrome bc1 complex Rieske iron-sulfur subunit n=1 Tax=Pseudonocardia acidicola TaxID=2724939 RepID=A0ABX1S3G0_9PSEU|nr:Rieske (2Fe-2S) protein [Pseudonocardia acidicola]NMH96115.1 Rieske (2Fe-2S) protein [Pseudonocardia acidicola]